MALLHQLDAGDDAGEQVVEVVGDPAGELAQGIHLLRLQQLLFGACPFGDLMGELAGGRRDFLSLGALAVTLFGYVFDEHQANALGAVGGDLPFGFARLAVDLHLQWRVPAFARLQVRTQFGEHCLLAGSEACRQGGGWADRADQQFECVIAFVQLQFGVEHRDGGGDMEEDFPEARFAVTQCALGVAHPQQGAQCRQQHIGVDRVDQVGIAAGIEAGDDVVGLDGGGGDVNQRQQRGVRIGTQLARNVEAAHVRQVDVENQRIGRGTGDQRQAFAAGTRLQGLDSRGVPAPGAFALARGGVVIDDQQAAVTLHRAPPPGSQTG